ncbi:MAG: D-2-hydroxyacid dehydrogenase [Chlamydiia bacterium]|nr:D-2-hydroxyacid dehydrogenase [Chlamydiia bacterium]
MNIALLRVPLTLGEIDQLAHEFPQFLFLSYPEAQLKKISPEHWAKVEILFGDRLTSEELSQAEALKWIHSPTSHLSRLPLEELEVKENVLVTCTLEENAPQIAEFVMGAFLAFAKQFFRWSQASDFPALIWDAKWRQKMETLQNKTLVQIGMEKPGLLIAKKGLESGMKVISIDLEKTFHPFCKKNLSIKELHSVLPSADYVSVTLPMTREYNHWFGLKELELMKEDAVLSLIGPTRILGDQSKDAAPLFEKLRGAVIDAPFFTPLSPSSPLWKVPNLLITPGVSGRPKSEEREAFKLFRSNLRDYLHGNFIDMKHIVDTQVTFEGSQAL